MLLESLNAMILAGDVALQTTCGLSTVSHRVSIVRPGVLTFPALSEIRIQAGPLQRVHLGSDSLLCGQLAGLAGFKTGETGIEALAERFLKQLLSELEARGPRGEVHHLDLVPVTLAVRGLRSFGIRLETGAGEMFVLAEVPSRLEYELARGSGYLAAMESAYLPPEWEVRRAFDSQMAIDNFLVFLRKVEGDVYFEVPGAGGDTHYVHSGVLLDNGTFDGVRGLKFCTDLTASVQSGLKRGDVVRATVGVSDRSLEFFMPYLGASQHPLANGAELSCGFFLPPSEVTVSQHRLAFRIDVEDPVPVVLRSQDGGGESAPTGDGKLPGASEFRGVLADLSFSGARIVAEDTTDHFTFEINRHVVCECYFPETDQPVSLLGVVRRLNSRLVSRDHRRHEIGLEFLVGGEADREALNRVRQYVLSEQRSRLARRVQIL